MMAKRSLPEIQSIAAERKIKGWSRAKKEALIKGDWESIRQFAKRRAGRPKLEHDPSS